ncbi:MAG TPA: TIGR03364 family FAD-dependent oxidoreductase [Chitinophagaceae bacterium]|jgi:FAD dependent oxidoreductase TIGR03364|nr:TIGR03364 family FAD-dependent oxidoreductase [Chitinophagaceae bacterium]
MHKTAIVVGAGIVGLATARALAVRKYDVKLIERNARAVGASVRNFGMIWPIGQPDVKLYERALLSASIWKEICNDANIWYDEAGSLHLAYNGYEWNVLNELADVYKHRQYRLLSPDIVAKTSPTVMEQKLLGALYSPREIIVDPREALKMIPVYLNEKYGVECLWNKTVTEINYPSVFTADEEYHADEIYVCSGADFETLYPSFYSTIPVTKCKLQMMRMSAQPENDRIGPALCGGLSLVHYKSFEAAASLTALKEYFENEYPEYLKWGIHVMVSQNQAGELTVGDSHEYGLTHDPFDKRFINQMILDYLKKFARFKDETIIETWNGIYPKLTNGETELVLQPEEGVTIINCLGGAGMTLSFGLCEQIVSRCVKYSMS